MRRGYILLIGGGAAAVVVAVAGFFTLYSVHHARLANTAVVSHPSSAHPAVVAASSTPTPSSSSTATSTPAAAAQTSGAPQAAAGAAQTQALATISIPRIGVRNAPVYDRGTTSKGIMLIAPGYAVTHYAASAPLGAGNAVLYGHDDIQGNIFGHLYDLNAGDMIQVQVAGQTLLYRVTGHEIVAPTDVAVMDATADVRLTIITCWPFNVDTQRWIVTAIKT